MPQTSTSHRPPWDHGAASSLWQTFGAVLVLLTLDVGVHAQAEVSLEELKAKATEAFEDHAWGEAHRAYAELLSLDGTSAHLQMRYAATLLHDDRLRAEGIQRLASLAEREALRGEGMYWWGKSWMLQGRSEQAEIAFELALGQAEKKSTWRSDCQRALEQSRELPVGFAALQRLKKLDVVEVPRTSFHRYVQWAAEGVRLMSVPSELQSKRDKKADVKASVALQRSSKEVLFHSLGPKAEQGLDIWQSTLNGKGAFDKPIRLPNEVNSPYDEINPVWDESSQCLTFGSNRPGTLGGMDIFRSCKEDGVWTQAIPLGPSFNSVHDDLAYFPCIGDEVNGWLVTTRAGEFGAVEVWEVALDGVPATPLQLRSNWDMGEEAMPGMLTLFDAQTDQTLAKVEFKQGRGQWDLVVSSGQVIHYVYETDEGMHVEGTYALPESDVPALVEQHMKWSPTRNDVRVATQLSDGSQSMGSHPEMAAISWGWEAVLDDVPTLAVQEWSMPDVDVVTQLEVTSSDLQVKRVVQFQSFPWWTEFQKEERDIAAGILSEHAIQPAKVWPEASGFDDVASYFNALMEAGDHAQVQVLQSIVSRAAADVIMEDVGWDDALRGVLDLGSDYWESIGWPREELKRKAGRIWAEAGVRFDEGLVSNVRDKRGLVGDRRWIDEPWTDGTLVAHLNNATWSKRVEPEVAALSWSLANQSDRLEALVNPKSTEWMDVRFWEVASISVASTQRSDTRGLERETLREEMQLRLNLLDAMNASPAFDQEAIDATSRTWQMVSSPFIGKGEGAMDDSTKTGVADTDDAELGLRGTWETQWAELIELESERVVSRELAPWRTDMLSWLKTSLEDESLPRPLLQHCLAHHSERTGLIDNPLDPGRKALSGNVLELSQAMIDMSGTHQSVDEAFKLLEATWLMNDWIHEASWKEATLDQVLMELDYWPELVEEALPQMRVEWAQARVNLDEQWGHEQEVPLDVSSEADQRVANREDANDVLPTDAPKARQSVDAGCRGIHLGWFRNAPQVGALPRGTRLVHEMGKQGLRRWVLLMEDTSGVSPGEQKLASWLGSLGVPDAYEVQWDGVAWGRPEVLPVPQQGEGEAEAIWASGRPVDLSMLDGTWHAVQVGVFSGEPDEAWLSAAGNRIVKEPLPDGRAKWFVATSRDASMAKRNLGQLRNHPSFADAFIVRLEDGVRNIAVDDQEAGAETVDSPASGNAGGGKGRSEDVAASVSIQTQIDDRRRAPDVGVRQGADQVMDANKPPEDSKSSTLWHVAIAKYNGTVPSDEVAAFLIKSAEWGVRSVELFGQTTYYSRSFVDLKEAQEMLVNVQAEGFSQARVEALN